MSWWPCNLSMYLITTKSQLWIRPETFDAGHNQISLIRKHFLFLFFCSIIVSQWNWPLTFCNMKCPCVIILSYYTFVRIWVWILQLWAKIERTSQRCFWDTAITKLRQMCGWTDRWTDKHPKCKMDQWSYSQPVCFKSSFCCYPIKEIN